MGTSAQQLPPTWPSGASLASGAGPEVDTLADPQSRPGPEGPPPALRRARGTRRAVARGTRTVQNRCSLPEPVSRALSSGPCKPPSGFFSPVSRISNCKQQPPAGCHQPATALCPKLHTHMSCSRRISETMKMKENHFFFWTSSRYNSSHENPSVSNNRFFFFPEIIFPLQSIS